MGYSEFAQEVSQHIHVNASRYFPRLDGAEINVRIIEEQHRAFSALYRFEVTDHLAQYNIFVKGTPLENNPKHEASKRESRARLVPQLADYGERTRLEYYALKKISDYFENLANPRFGTIRVLDFISSPQTIIMEENSDPSLRHLFTSTNHLNHLFGRESSLLMAFFNAGAWLREFSTIPEITHAKSRHTTREEFNKSIVNFADFLGRVTGNASFFRRVEGSVISIAHETMPSDLPLGIGHGDYAMRNILVGEDDRITAFDTGAKWKVPIYEDIAYFLVNLETNRAQMYTQGLAIHSRTLAAYQREFLAGYFGETHIPIKLIQLFKILLLLDSWSSRSSIYTQKDTGIMGLYHNLYLTLVNRQYRVAVERLINELDENSS
jgi:hypothetical protein